MRYSGVCHLTAVIVVLLITWRISIYTFDEQEKTLNIFGFNRGDQSIKSIFEKVTGTTRSKCSLSQSCPSDHFVIRIRSGAAYVVGPKICFEDKIIMSHVLNNVGLGLNIVVINSENGEVEKFGYLNIRNGNPQDMLAYVKAIKPGMIVLVASFDDVAPMTNETKEVFAGMGSTLIFSVKRRDGWVFAGRVGAKNKSLFEKISVNDEKTNVFDGWPDMVEVGGCFPKNDN